MGWITAVVVTGLVSVVIVLHASLHNQVATRANDHISTTLHEFHRFTESRGANPPVDTEQLLTEYLQLRYPDRGEVLYGFVSGSPTLLANNGPDVPPGFTFEQHPDLQALLLSTPSGVTETPYGTLRWGTTEIRTTAGETSGHLVVMVFTGPMTADADRTTRMLVLVSIVTLVLSGLASWLVSGQILKPIRLVQRTAAELTERDLTRRIEVQGRDDIADLAATFNAMLDRLEKAFATEKRFVDDAGHELRTPITIIRGHLELMGDDPVERRQTVALVTQELDRMSRIVTDLLLLTKAEQPDFVTVSGPVDVAEICVELDSLVGPLGDRKWQLLEVAEGEVPLDRQRIIQAVLQLAQNAVQHTTTGDRIELASRFNHTPQGRIVEFTVTDDGPGVSDRDRGRIFDRFARGLGQSRPDDTQRGGAGLGLAIVRAIAEGHHGGVDVHNVSGRGACFRLWIPAPPPAGEQLPDLDQTVLDPFPAEVAEAEAPTVLHPTPKGPR